MMVADKVDVLNRCAPMNHLPQTTKNGGTTAVRSHEWGPKHEILLFSLKPGKPAAAASSLSVHSYTSFISIVPDPKRFKIAGM